MLETQIEDDAWIEERKTKWQRQFDRVRTNNWFRQKEDTVMQGQVNIWISLPADVFFLTGCHFPTLLHYLVTKAAVDLM